VWRICRPAAKSRPNSRALCLTGAVGLTATRDRTPEAIPRELGFVTNVGSSSGTNAAPRRPPSVAHRHHVDDTLDRPKLRAVSFTAASCDNCFLQAGQVALGDGLPRAPTEPGVDNPVSPAGILPRKQQDLPSSWGTSIIRLHLILPSQALLGPIDVTAVAKGGSENNFRI
jgi:hypothetical protein